MVKKAILLFAATSCLGFAQAQVRCFTDEVTSRLKAEHPDIAKYEAQLKAEIDQQLGKMDLSKFKTTSDTIFKDNEVLHVPIVFHVIHDYGTEYVTDQAIYQTLESINRMYSRQNADTASVINTYKGNIPGTNIRYIGKANIEFHLATIDPMGKPSHGITRRRSYLTTTASDQAKYDLWAPTSYMNIWVVNKFNADHQGAAAYAYKPATAAVLPYVEGVITLASYLNQDNTLSHELGHTLNLDHPWGATNQAGSVNCGDDDVDDTPPTRGHNITGCTPAARFDSACATGYMKIYGPATAYNLFGIVDTVPVVINYPDTTNAENVMDYTYCSRMFTYLQTVRMRTALKSSVAGRNNLFSEPNLVATGLKTAGGQIFAQPYKADPTRASWPDLAPVADFSTNVSYLCPTQNVTFTSRSWNDTIASVKWTFVSGGNTTESTASTVIKNFTSPGWVTTTLVATGNGASGSGTTTMSNVYVADHDNPINATGYFQEFNTPGDMDKYPSFNYFNNSSKWETVNNAGFYDNTSIRYKNYDSRVYPAAYVGTPMGDYDDFFTPPFDLSNMGSGNVFLNFWTSGASRSNVLAYLNDSLQISYSTCPSGTSSWTYLTSLSKGQLYNKGTGYGANIEWVPAGFWDWVPKSINLPATIKNGQKVYFRFRYYSAGANTSTPFDIGTGNHFYIDRLYISPWTTEVGSLEAKENGIAVAPNPTSGNTSVVIKDNKNKVAEINVTDITGKLVFSTTAQLNGGMTKVEIPANYIAVKGMYLIQVTTGAIKQTEKLVVY